MYLLFYGETTKMVDRVLQISNHLTPSGDLSRVDGQVVLITGAAQGMSQ